MKGHVQDRWYRDREDSDGNLILGKNKRPLREKTDLYGVGLRYKARYYDATGRERSKSFADKEKEKADNFLIAMQHDVLAGRFIDIKAGEMSLLEYGEIWKKGQSQDGATQQMLTRRMKKRIYPILGRYSLKEISTDRIRDWLDWLKKEGLKGSYRAGLFDIVSAILESAKADKRISDNPCKAKSVKRPQKDRAKIRPWTERKVHAVEEALPESYKIIVPLGAGAALRQMEIFGLSPDDIDRDEMELHIERQIKWIGSTPVFALPKGKKTRTIPIGEGVLDELDAYMERFEPQAVTLPWEDPDGDPITVNLLIDRRQDDMNTRSWGNCNVWWGGKFTQVVWKPALGAAGFQINKNRDGMHALRHFCASTWLANGVTIREVAEYLGHSDPGYTLRIYTHLVPSSHRRARAATNTIFVPKLAAAA
ncbi:site-specific integrase [Amycolatopsis thailandensis]|uniref:Site-specific integrase n=1 Tax=Amycolatopsis thailandensis TaxID=589330 RepID=A0A229SBV8_9PSEU|nr:site-specific integrase [Amycolatopsis thailandensis]OXM56402.1 site-specific integrase [Amycolatopsis thailandensis]